jgi:hypothetical protein
MSARSIVSLPEKARFFKRPLAGLRKGLAIKIVVAALDASPMARDQQPPHL